jgi:hypothetical protein
MTRKELIETRAKEIYKQMSEYKLSNIPEDLKNVLIEAATADVEWFESQGLILCKEAVRPENPNHGKNEVGSWDEGYDVGWLKCAKAYEAQGKLYIRME